MRVRAGRAGRRRQRDRGAYALATGIAAVLLLLAGGYLRLLGAGGAPRDAAIGGPFALVAGDGRPVTDRSFRGKFLLIYFGYTACRDVCPLTLAAVAAALDRLGARAAEVQPLFVTVDPGRDTPDVVRAYAASFTPRLVGLTGTPDQIARVLQEYRVSSVVHRAGPLPARYAVDHSSVLYLVGPDGRYLAPIRADAPADAMASAIARRLS